jgi:NTP pyrophosphatase (non-canonical NTP hydrolase)
MKNDKSTTIQELKDILLKFRDERDWKQFHDPKNLAEAITIEAGELLEHFLWKKDGEVIAEIEKEEVRKKIKQELADIICFCINFANSTGIDISSAVIEKIEENMKKYPVEKAKNTAKKYTEL